MKNNISLIYPDKSKKNTFTHFEFMESLGLDGLINITNNNWKNQSKLSLNDFFTMDVETIKYRAALFGELMSDKKLLELFYEVMPKIETIYELRTVRDERGDTESNLFVIREIELYIECMEFLSERLGNGKIQSKAILGLKDAITTVTSDESFKSLKKEVNTLSFKVMNIKSVTIGVNLDAQFRPIEAGITAINDKLFKSGSVIDKMLRMDMSTDAFTCMSPLTPIRKGMSNQEITSLNNSFNSALNGLLNKSVRSWKPAVKSYLAAKTDLLVDLLDELRFVLAVTVFLSSLKDKGYPVCIPEIVKPSENNHIKSLYNPKVALYSESEEIVYNDLDFDENGMLYILTGPNQGGKSVFTYAVGLIYALLHLGVPVPAKSATVSLVSGIYTHFPKKDENNVGKGRFSEECERIGVISKEVTEGSLILFDETLSSTSGTEAACIAGELLTAFGVKGAKGIFATHLHDISSKVGEYNAHERNKSKVDNLSAASEKTESGSLSFKISRKASDGLSYAKDIAQKYGISQEQLCK